MSPFRRDRAAGNAYLNEFREDYNRRFACIPRKERDAHRALLSHEDLARVFSWQEERRLTNNLTLHYKRVLYVVESTPASEKVRRKLVGVREDEDGSVHIEYRGIVLKARAFAEARQALATPAKKTTASPMSASHPLADVLAWAKQQARD